MNARLRLNLLMQVVSVILVSFMLSCSSGGSSPDQGGNGVAPQIFGLDKSSANIGDTVLVIGNNFGSSQSSGGVTLNGVAFQINSWTDTQISANVASGMTSGIVVVNQGGLPSQSGQQAQLFIGNVPAGDPVIYALSPDYGRKGEDQVLITGANFGPYSTAEDTGVFFSADVAVSAAGYVKAQVVVNATSGQPEWTSSSVRVIVPSNAKTGDLYVLAGGKASNHRAFEAQPPAGPQGAPVISSFNPPSGPVGTQVTILGINFGNAQGNSTLTISGKGFNVIDWTNTQILASVPAGATSAALNISVGTNSAVSGTNFIVANTPVITGVTPTSMHVGQPLTIYGNFFGFTQGAGTLKVGSTTVAVDAWNDTTIQVTTLPGLNVSDPNNVPIVVTNDASLASAPFPAKLVSDISGLMTVKPKAGVAGKTNFTFTISAAGGSGNYEYTLIPNKSDPNTTKTGTSTITNQYATKGTYSTQVRIKDNVSGDLAVIDGPDVTVVGPDDMVITNIEMVDFGQPDAAENAFPLSLIYKIPSLDLVYNDFVFYQNQVWYTSGLGDLFAGNTKLPAFTRDQAGFMAGGGPSPRPYAYRRANGSGSLVRIHGFNFGTAQGNIYLNSAAPAPGDPIKQVPAGNISGWDLPGSVADQDELIEFVLPSSAGGSLSGFVCVSTPGDAKSVKSIDPLLCSALVTDTQPKPVPIDASILQISAYDLQPPVLAGISGSSTKLIFAVQATYPDPFTAGNPVTGPKLVLCVHPIDATVAGNSITFNMNSLDNDAATAGVQNDIEAYNAAGTAYQMVPGATIVPGAWQFCIWTGADLSSGSNVVKANSGLLSDAVAITVTAAGGGGGGNVKPNAALSGNPLNFAAGSGGGTVNFNAGASADPDGSITKYEFDFGDPAPGTFVDNGTTATASHAYAGVDGQSWTVTVRVTDDGSPGLTDTATVTVKIGSGGGGGGNGTCPGILEHLTADWTDPFNPPPGKAPTPGATIHCFDDPALTNEVATAITAADGSFTLTALPTGVSVYIVVDAADILQKIILPPGYPVNGYADVFILDDVTPGGPCNLMDANNFNFPGGP